MALTTKLPLAIDSFAALVQSDWIDAVVVSVASTAERSAIPSGAKFVLFSGTFDFYAKIGGSGVVAAVPATEVADGTASMCNPTLRKIPDGATHISIVSAAVGAAVTLEYFKAI